jgi:hypothetical protein
LGATVGGVLTATADKRAAGVPNPGKGQKGTAGHMEANMLSSIRSNPTEQDKPATVPALMLAYRLRGKNERGRARVAAELVRGGVEALTEQAAARICMCSPYRVRQALHNGHNGYRRKRAVVTDAAVDRIVSEVGVNRLWAALDRATRPEIVDRNTD